MRKMQYSWYAKTLYGSFYELVISENSIEQKKTFLFVFFSSSKIQFIAISVSYPANFYVISGEKVSYSNIDE